MKIRPETPHDYAAIAGVHMRAFGRLEEALIVPLHRERQDYDPELALVAEADGRVVGHALFNPQTIRLLGEDVRTVNLAPIGIDPTYQRQGIGSALMQEGHRLAAGKGFALSILLGHVEYYPRFGYRTGMFGVSSVRVATATLPKRRTPSTPLLQTRAPQEADIPALQRLWLHEEGNVDFAVVPGDSLLDWVSPNPLVESSVYLREGAIAGYTRIRTTEPASPLVFLAADANAARMMAADIGFAAHSVTLPLHPCSASATAFDMPHTEAWQPAMVCPLLSSPFDEYESRLRAGERLPGRPQWGTAFDLALYSRPLFTHS